MPATYQVFLISPSKVFEVKAKGAPHDSWMLEKGKNKNASFVLRYYPSRKRWEAIDIRQAQAFQRAGQKYMIWYGHTRLAKTWPNADAAIMEIMAKISSRPMVELT